VSFVELKDVKKKFGNETVLNINLTLREGEALGVLGKSGSGKSVLMHMLRGMEEYAPSAGHVIYHIAICSNCMWADLPSKAGSPCPKCSSPLKSKAVDFWQEDKSLQEAVRKRISIIFQRTFALYGYLTPLENIMEALKSIKIPEKDAPRTAYMYLKKVNMVHRMLHPAEDLSGGEKQRVVLARQLAVDPALFLADEPTGTLDPENAEAICKLLSSEVKAKGRTMFVASHLPNVVEMLADRAIWLDQGKIAMEGDVKAVAKSFLASTPFTPIETKSVGREVVKVSDLRKDYFSIDRGLVKAVDGVSLGILERECFGIFGSSGGGKTTLSKIIAGYIEPSHGTVQIRLGDKWEDVKNVRKLSRTESGYIGFLHQEYALYPHRTILENLTDAIGLELPGELARIKAIYVLKGAGFDEKFVEKKLDLYADELSEGERHKVGLAQVLIKEPRIVILDEPSGTMDPSTKIEVMKSIKQAQNTLGETFIIVSHDIDFVGLTCDRAALMQDGKIVKLFERDLLRKMASAYAVFTK